jgi:pimeloyl-ACP methyl ester carboxylesterase
MTKPWTHHTMQVNGFRMHFVVAGSGSPLVFLRGWPQTWYAWRKVIPPLAAPSARVLREEVNTPGATHGLW